MTNSFIAKEILPHLSIQQNV